MAASLAFDPAAPHERAPLLVITGSDETLREKAGGGFRGTGMSDIIRLIPPGLRFDQLNLGKQFLKAQGRPDPARYPCVLNLVTDPDQHPETLERARKLLRGIRGRVINSPEAVLRTTRDQVAKRLAGIPGLRVPKILRLRNPKPGAASLAAERGNFAFPLIVRHAGTHTGKIVGIAGNADELEAACAAPGTYFVIEYAEFRSDDGHYRKYRLWSFGGRTIFRHMVVSDHWNVHVKDRLRFMVDRDELIAEEMALLERPEGAFPESVHQLFDAVKGRMGVDFFGMDFGFEPDGRIVLFEANSTMSFFPLIAHPKFSYLGQIQEPAQVAFKQMLFPDP